MADGRPPLEVALMFTFVRAVIALQISPLLASIRSVDCMKDWEIAQVLLHQDAYIFKAKAVACSAWLAWLSLHWSADMHFALQ